MRSKALNETQPIAMPMAEVAGSTGDWAPCMTDRMRIVGVGFDDAEPDTLAIIVTEHPEDLHEYAAVRIREHTYWDAFCDLWAMLMMSISLPWKWVTSGVCVMRNAFDAISTEP